MFYKNTEVYTIEKGCPWYEMQQRFGPPNVNWCEPTYCSWINEPANTWTNWGMILPGLIVHYHAKKFKNLLIRNFGFAMMMMGICSFIYHATNNYLTQFLDFIGMYFYTGSMIAINIQRLKPHLKNESRKVFWLVFAANMGIFWLVHFTGILSIQFTIILNLVIVLTLEFLTRSKTVKYKNFYLGLLLMAIAQTFSLLDHTRVWCEPSNHILHGHAIWHVLAGVSSIFSYLYYTQFDKELS